MNIYILIHIKHLIEYPFYQISDTRLQSSAQEDPSDRSWLQKGDALGGEVQGGLCWLVDNKEMSCQPETFLGFNKAFPFDKCQCLIDQSKCKLSQNNC